MVDILEKCGFLKTHFVNKKNNLHVQLAYKYFILKVVQYMFKTLFEPCVFRKKKFGINSIQAFTLEIQILNQSFK